MNTSYGLWWTFLGKLRWNRPKTRKAHISVWPIATKTGFDKLVLICECWGTNTKCHYSWEKRRWDCKQDVRDRRNSNFLFYDWPLINKEENSLSAFRLHFQSLCCNFGIIFCMPFCLAAMWNHRQRLWMFFDALPLSRIAINSSTFALYVGCNQTLSLQT